MLTCTSLPLRWGFRTFTPKSGKIKPYIGKLFGKLSKLNRMGVGGSRLKESDLPEGSEHYFGLENFSNICYSNSVL